MRRKANESERKLRIKLTIHVGGHLKHSTDTRTRDFLQPQIADSIFFGSLQASRICRGCPSNGFGECKRNPNTGCKYPPLQSQHIHSLDNSGSKADPHDEIDVLVNEAIGVSNLGSKADDGRGKRIKVGARLLKVEVWRARLIVRTLMVG